MKWIISKREGNLMKKERSSNVSEGSAALLSAMRRLELRENTVKFDGFLVDNEGDNIRLAISGKSYLTISSADIVEISKKDDSHSVWVIPTAKLWTSTRTIASNACNYATDVRIRIDSENMIAPS